MTRFLQNNKASIAAGLISALLLASVTALRFDDKSTALVMIVFTIVPLPIFVFGWKVLWFERESYRAERKRALENVENQWEKEASSFAFWALSAGLVLSDTLGRGLGIDWLGPINIVHFFVIGGVSFLGYYLWQKRSQG